MVGASGAIFGLFGILFAASRMHLPMLDRRGRALLGQIGILIVINIIIGFAWVIDNVAHLGGFVTGVLLGVAFPPGRVATLRSIWQPGTDGPVVRGFIGTPAASILSLGILAVGIALGLVVGFQRWS